MDDIEKQIAKEFGLNLSNSTKNLLEEKREVVPISPKLDIITGGGIPEGSNVIVSGPYKAGKTQMALKIAANAQALPSPKYGPRKVYFFNIEGRLKERDLRGVDGLKTDPDHWMLIQSEPGNILTAAKYLSIAERLINEKPGCVFIIDSYSSLLTEGERNATLGERYRADSPLLLGSWTRRISNVVPVNNVILIGITHRIANMGNGRAETSEASGNKVQFACDVKLRFTHKTPWTVGTGEKEVQIGQDMHVVCEWSALDATPNMKTSSRLRYGYGIDFEQEIADLACDLGIIEKKASWFTLPDGKKLQGTESVRQYMIENPVACLKIANEIRSMFGLKEYENKDSGRESNKVESEG